MDTSDRDGLIEAQIAGAFMEDVLKATNQRGSGRANRVALTLATAFVSRMGEEAVAKACFGGDRAAKRR